MYDLTTEHALAGTVDDLTVAVVGGGSRNWARTLMNDLAQCPDLGGTVRLYDRDEESAERNARLGALYDDHPDAVSDWTYEAVADLDAALSGAEFVVCSTQDPPAETMRYDLDVPAEYGVYQSVGDTVGPGGILRAMRAIPQYLAIGRAVRDNCPNAWVLNYTNPMSVCTRTLYEAYPDIDAIGLCHEVDAVQRHFAGLVTESLDVDETPSGDEIDLAVNGINHFTWVDEARWRGRDLFALLDRELAAKRPLPEFEPGDLEDADYFVDNDNVAYDLYDTYGVFPAAGDRHLAEFVPWYLDVDDPRDVHRWGFRLTPSEYRVQTWPTGERERNAILDGEAAIELRDSGEEMVDVVCAFCGLTPLRTNVNYPNRGQCSNLPDGAVVETNALLTADRCTPQTAGSLPPAVETLVERHVTNQEMLVEAGVRGDVDRAYRAFRNDPLVSVGADAARDMFRDLVRAQEPYLRDWNLDDATVLAEG